MKQQEFIINGRFLVTPSLNAFRDLHTQKEIRLEARLMQLLCLLGDAAEAVVTCDHIIKEIWDDYGGGDEGLSQAIFHLRKALDDTDKKIIETIPKKGYILHAVITSPKESTAKMPRQKHGKFIILVLSIAIVGIVVFVFLNSSVSKENPLPKEPVAIPYPELNEGEYTITTVDSSGTRYKLVQVGDGRPVLYINDKEVGIEEQEKHLLLIHKMSEALREKR